MAENDENPECGGPTRQLGDAETQIAKLAEVLSDSMHSALSNAMDGFMSQLDARLSRPYGHPIGSQVRSDSGITTTATEGMSSVINSSNCVGTGGGAMPSSRAIASVPLMSLPSTVETTTLSHSLSSRPICTPTTSDTVPKAIVIGPNASLIPISVVQKIRNNEFIELADLLGDNLSEEKSLDKSKDSKRKKRKITNILQWVECFNAYVTILNQPDRLPDLLAYSSLIVHAARKFKGDNWIAYDRNFRKQAAATRNQKWADIDMSLWALAFAKAEPQESCSICFSLDHKTQDCEDYTKPTESEPSTSKQAKTSPICLKWNWQYCQSSSCTYRHNICVECHEPHKARNCPSLAQHKRYTPYQKRQYQERPGKRGDSFRDKRY